METLRTFRICGPNTIQSELVRMFLGAKLYPWTPQRSFEQPTFSERERPRQRCSRDKKKIDKVKRYPHKLYFFLGDQKVSKNKFASEAVYVRIQYSAHWGWS